MPEAVEPLAQSVLAEALRNAASTPADSVRVRVGEIDGTFVLEVRNDGARRRRRGGAGMGLRLAAVEALQRGALVEFGPDGRGLAVRLVVPLEEMRPSEPGPEPARAGGGRPRRGPLGLPAAPHRTAMGRALPDGVERRGGARDGAPLRAARRAGGPVPRRGVGRRAVRGDQARVAQHAHPPDLGRGLDLSSRREGRRRVGVRLEGLAGARRGDGGADGGRA